MISQAFIQSLVDGLVAFASDTLVPVMVSVFCLGIALRALIYYTIRREHWFAKEFEKRVDTHLEDAEKSETSFYVSCKKLLEKTYYELFEVRAIMMRRKPDYIMSLTDRIFWVQNGCARLVKATLAQAKHLKFGGQHPKLLEIAKNVFENNPSFNRVFGVLPASMFNDVLSILPGLFIIGGIFGTFLGIMKALPELGGMNLNDVEGTKAIMDGFLLKISFAMTTSIVGIILSVSMTVVNTLLSPDKLFITIVNRYENSLDKLWYCSADNRLPSEIPDFDEHKDPLEALAEQAIAKEIDRKGTKLEDKAKVEPTAS